MWFSPPPLATMRSFFRPIPSRALQTSYALRPASRAFSCAPQLRLKEDKEQTPEQVEKAKQEQMKGNKNARDELTSSSEAAVHADKEQPADKNSHIQEMQKQTANKSQQEKNGQ
ncbi:hypothetical protein D0862_01794 [Hortaea werneckii]|uniref:Uncharacterized protein n=1 Tax=Hortaea werneckii TaxID=91943 RepID=A0A3M7HPF0_HORWE|nr:hypothetical protein D0862_01794 [Hortaea werneckii]